jgi:hypothetical protein
MEDRAEKQNSEPTNTFSKLDWPTPEMLPAARRARGKALSDMGLALGPWLKRKVERFSLGLYGGALFSEGPGWEVADGG